MVAKKRFTKRKRKAKVSKAVKSYVKNTLDKNIEDKHMYAAFGQTLLNNGTQASVQHIPLPAQGDGADDRTGARIKIKYIKVSIEVRSSGAQSVVDFASKNQNFRLMMIRFNHTNASSGPAIAGTNQGIFQTTVAGAGYNTALPNPIACNTPGDVGNKNKLYTIVYDRVKPMKLVYPGGVIGSAANTVGAIAMFKIIKKYPKGLYVNFTDANTGISTSVQDYTHWLLGAIGNTAVDNSFGWTYDGHYDICYEDA